MKLLQRWIYLAGILSAVSVSGSCQLFSMMEEVQEDKRSEYRQSEPLPDLEVPPDLLLESDELALHIPDPENRPPQDAPRTQPEAPEATKATEDAPVPENTATEDLALATPVAETRADKNIIEVAADHDTVWPLLVEYFLSKGRSLNIQDQTLGVIETSWSAPYLQQQNMMRDRVSILIEPGITESTIRLAFSSDRQLFRQDDQGGGDWELTGRVQTLEKGMLSELEHFLKERI